MKESGQIIIILLLMMLVGLSIGLVITQRSVTDVATSTQSEQSQRAFSAAEAGIEQALSQNSAPPDLSLGNESKAQVSGAGAVPIGIAPGEIDGQALEYPPIDKTKTAHFWIANPDDLSPVGNLPDTMEVYFGNPSTTDLPAVEVNLITKEAGVYKSNRRFFDSDATRRNDNQFEAPASCVGNPQIVNIANIKNESPSAFYCRATISYAALAEPMIVRVRLLYSNGKHKIALKPKVGFLPPQAEIYTSVGSAGQSQKTLRVFRMKKVVPFLFDFALFSAGDISK